MPTRKRPSLKKRRAATRKRTTKTRAAKKRPAKKAGMKAALEQWVEEDSGEAALDAQVKVLKDANALLRRKLRYSGAAADLIVRAVEDVWETAPDLTVPKPPKASRKSRVEVAVAHISDTQIGKITSSYDSSIAAVRLAKYGDRVAACIVDRQQQARIDEVRLYLGGDMVEGETIFAGQAHSIDSGLLDQAVRNGPAMIARMVAGWLGVVRKVRVVCVAGNHGRPAPKGTGSHPATNWDTVFYLVLAHMLKEHSDRVEVIVPDDWYAVDDVLGWRNFLFHGHQVKGGFAGFPWYGVGKKVQGWLQLIEGGFHNAYMGHFHTYTGMTVNHVTVYCNGTTESDNEYAREELAAGGEPKQRLQFFDAKHGVVSDYPIYLRG